MVAHNRPLLTNQHSNASDFTPEQNSVYLLGISPEERSLHHHQWQQRSNNISFVNIVEQKENEFTALLRGQPKIVALRSTKQLLAFYTSLGTAKTLYIDITGIDHHVWAPLLRAALSTFDKILVVYTEPNDYRPSSSPTEGAIFDLSERILGIAPIPGFASLRTERTGNICFVPLLGFEGTRFSYLIEHVQPPNNKIFPVIGVPGFRPEYPFYTFLGNRSALSLTGAWKNRRFADANCPFSLFYLLQEIMLENAMDQMKIAPIGTKPHALGAVLYHLANPLTTEIVYDFPIRKGTRTEGMARLLEYEVSALPIPAF